SASFSPFSISSEHISHSYLSYHDDTLRFKIPNEWFNCSSISLNCFSMTFLYLLADVVRFKVYALVILTLEPLDVVLAYTGGASIRLSPLDAVPTRKWLDDAMSKYLFPSRLFSSLNS